MFKSAAIQKGIILLVPLYEKLPLDNEVVAGDPN